MSTKEQILDAAETEIETVGSSDFRIQRVAAAAGVTAPLIYRHFDSREALIDTAVLNRAERLSRVLLDAVICNIDAANREEDFDVALSVVFGEVYGATSEASDTLRWAIAKALVIAWSHPELPTLALDNVREIYRRTASFFSDRLGQKGIVEPETIAYVFLTRWFGGIIVDEAYGRSSELSTSPELEVAFVNAVRDGPHVFPLPDPTPFSLDIPAPTLLDQGARTTKGKIIDAAIEELAAVGSVAATVKGIAMRAGIDPPLIYRHFSSRSDLLAIAGVIANERLFSGRLQAIKPIFTPVATMGELLGRNAAIVGPDVGGISEFVRRSGVSSLVAARHYPEAMETAKRTALAFSERHATWIRSLQDASIIGDHFSATHIAVFLLCMTYGASLCDGDPVMSISADQFEAIFVVFWRDALGA